MRVHARGHRCPTTWFAAAKVRADTASRGRRGRSPASTPATRLADERIFGELVTEESAGAYYPGVQLVQETADVAFSLPPIPAAEEFTADLAGAVNAVVNEGADPARHLPRPTRKPRTPSTSAQ